MKKNIIAILLSLIITATHAVASVGFENSEFSLITTFFIGLGVLVILFQFIPGLLLFSIMLKNLFSNKSKEVSKHTGEIL